MKLYLKGEVPKIEGMTLTKNLMAFIERKLFTLNTGHAITAYLGVLKGYKTIKESIEGSRNKKHSFRCYERKWRSFNQ